VVVVAVGVAATAASAKVVEGKELEENG